MLMWACTPVKAGVHHDVIYANAYTGHAEVSYEAEHFEQGALVYNRITTGFFNGVSAGHSFGCLKRSELVCT